jgi:transposase
MPDLTKNEYALAINEHNLKRLESISCTDHEKLVIAVTIVRSGASYPAAAKATGVSIHKIYDAIAEKMPRDAKEDMMEELAMDISIHASLAIMERIQDGSIRSSEMVKALQVSRDTVARKRRWDKDPDVIPEEKRSKLVELLEQVTKKITPTAEVVLEDEE